jgi:transcriptional regulator GlxA family with amidase domain
MPGETMPVAAGSASLTSLEVGGFKVTDAVFPPLLMLPRHYHEHTCIAVVLAGSLDKAFARTQFVSVESTLLTMPPQEPHKDRFERAGAHMLVVEPHRRGEETLRPCADILEGVNHFRDQGVAAIASRIAHEMEVPDEVSCLAVEGLVLEMLAVASRRYVQPRLEKRPPAWLLKAQEMVHSRYDGPLEVGEIASEVGVHPVHLSRVFRSHFGVSLGAYVRRQRLDWAARLLAGSDEPLSDLALRAGFADQSHFTRLFKRHTGLTPERYRQATRR